VEQEWKEPVDKQREFFTKKFDESFGVIEIRDTTDNSNYFVYTCNFNYGYPVLMLMKSHWFWYHIKVLILTVKIKMFNYKETEFIEYDIYIRGGADKSLAL
jgi:hypothetical protein